MENNETHLHDLGRPAAFSVREERPSDVRARERILDMAMGVGRKRKSSEKLRRGRLPASGLSLVATTLDGTLAGTVRLWYVHAGRRPDGLPVDALLLGPLAVLPSVKGTGAGRALMSAALDRARALGHGAILLVGEPAYYWRFGFDARLTANLSMPGPYEIDRFLALELVGGHLNGAAGILAASGIKKKRQPTEISIAA